jgi:hypothetical protein
MVLRSYCHYDRKVHCKLKGTFLMGHYSCETFIVHVLSNFSFRLCRSNTMNAVALYIAKMESCKSASQQFQVRVFKLFLGMVGHLPVASVGSPKHLDVTAMRLRFHSLEFAESKFHLKKMRNIGEISNCI